MKAKIKERLETLGAILVVWAIVMILYWLHTVNVWLAGLGAALVWVLIIDKREEVINKKIELEIGDTVYSGRISTRPDSPKGPVPTPPGGPRTEAGDAFRKGSPPCLPTDSSPCPFCGATGLTGGAWTCCERMAERLWEALKEAK